MRSLRNASPAHSMTRAGCRQRVSRSVSRTPHRRRSPKPRHRLPGDVDRRHRVANSSAQDHPRRWRTLPPHNRHSTRSQPAHATGSLDHRRSARRNGSIAPSHCCNQRRQRPMQVCSSSDPDLARRHYRAADECVLDLDHACANADTAQWMPHSFAIQSAHHGRQSHLTACATTGADHARRTSE